MKMSLPLSADFLRNWGVIRIRIHPPVLDDVTEALAHFFDVTNIRGTLIVLENDGFRIRRAALA
jgi:hypothetical protein